MHTTTPMHPHTHKHTPQQTHKYICPLSINTHTCTPQAHTHLLIIYQQLHTTVQQLVYNRDSNIFNYKTSYLQNYIQNSATLHIFWGRNHILLLQMQYRLHHSYGNLQIKRDTLTMNAPPSPLTGVTKYSLKMDPQSI